MTITSTQRVLIVTADVELLERLSSVVERSGAMPVAARDFTSIELQGGAPAVLPFRFVLYGFDGNVDALRRVAGRLRPTAQLVAVVPSTTLSQTIELLAESRCNHVVVGDDEGLAVVATTVTVSKFITGDLFGIEKYLPPRHARASSRACAITRAAPPRSTRSLPTRRRSACAARSARRSGRSAKSC